MTLRLLTLTTDFGQTDPYVAQMKGVALCVDPALVLVDLSHDLPPQDVAAAARFLAAAVPRFPRGTVHLCVVDPGVGGARRPMAVAQGGRTLVGPDNGCFSAFLDAGARCVHLDRPEWWLPEPSSTFHGRDVFAPVAAQLARGVPIDDVGSELSDPVRLARPGVRVAGGALEGVVEHVDHYGNLVTNVVAERLADLGGASREGYVVEIAGRSLEGPARSYDSVPAGTLLTHVGSGGAIEVAANRGRADAALAAGVGTAVTVARRRGTPRG